MTARCVKQKTKDLYEAFVMLKSTEDVENFLSDLMTPQEVEDFCARWHVANLLNEGVSQRDIARRTKVSITTVTRVNKFLKYGRGGYALVMSRLKKRQGK